MGIIEISAAALPLAAAVALFYRSERGKAEFQLNTYKAVNRDLNEAYSERNAAYLDVCAELAFEREKNKRVEAQRQRALTAAKEANLRRGAERRAKRDAEAANAEAKTRGELARTAIPPRETVVAGVLESREAKKNPALGVATQPAE
jgi:hypothetical protein